MWQNEIPGLICFLIMPLILCNTLPVSQTVFDMRLCGIVINLPCQSYEVTRLLGMIQPPYRNNITSQIRYVVHS